MSRLLKLFAREKHASKIPAVDKDQEYNDDDARSHVGSIETTDFEPVVYVDIVKSAISSHAGSNNSSNISLDDEFEVAWQLPSNREVVINTDNNGDEPQASRTAFYGLDRTRQGATPALEALKTQGIDNVSNKYSGVSRSLGASRSHSRSYYPSTTSANGPEQRDGKSTDARTPTQQGAGAGNTKVLPIDVRRCITLLRQMFGLRMQAWALEPALGRDRKLGDEKTRQADHLLAEIQGTLKTWLESQQPGQPPNWSEEEYEEVVWIAQILASTNLKVGNSMHATEVG